MKTTRDRWTKTGCMLAGGLCLLAVASSDRVMAAQSTQVIDARELILRLQRLERDMRDVQSETFRKPPGGDKPLAPAPVEIPPPEPPAPPPPKVDLDPLLRHVDQLEDSLGRLTGQMEELGHLVEQLSQKTDRLQKQLDLETERVSALVAVGEAQMAREQTPPAAEPGNTLASLAPAGPGVPGLRPSGAPPSNLGQIPAGAPLPAPAAAPADTKREFDAAMNLLSRAQYDQASEAFRKFADAHPVEDRASDALYWTGDIAYSAKKDYPEAARNFAELLKRFPKAQRAPEGMLKLGLALFELGQMKEGCAALVALPAKYPEATPAVAARARAERTSNKCR